MAKQKKSNLTFHPVPVEKRKRDNDSVCPDSVEVEVIRWKNRPFLRIMESTEFDSEDPHKSPEVERFFIQSLQEGHLRYFHGYAVNLQTARDNCEVIALDFEKFLNEWHNTKGNKNASNT